MATPPRPPTAISRQPERQRVARDELDALLDTTPLATVAFVRDGHPVAMPTAAARLGDDLVIHGSVGSPWLTELAAGVPASACVSALDGVLVARSGFESSFHYRSAVLFGAFEALEGADKESTLQVLLDTFIPGRSAELRQSTRRELAATRVLRLPIGADNWSLKVANGWPDDEPDDVAAGGWAGVVPLTTTYGVPLRAPDCDPAIPVPHSVLAMTGKLTNRRR